MNVAWKPATTHFPPEIFHEEFEAAIRALLHHGEYVEYSGCYFFRWDKSIHVVEHKPERELKLISPARKSSIDAALSRASAILSSRNGLKLSSHRLEEVHSRDRSPDTLRLSPNGQ